jgi:hypothetical protein
MSKVLGKDWFLQAAIDTEVKRLAPGLAITIVVQHNTDQIVWDEECEGLGRVPWYPGYLLPPDDPSVRALVPIFNAAIAPLQQRFDLGVTCERIS